MATCLNYSPNLPLECSTLVDLLRYRAQNQPDKIAYTFLENGEVEDISFTYQELDRRSQIIASQLQSLGMSGERALLLYPPGIEFISVFFGCLYAGVIAVPAYPPRRNQKLSRLQSIATDAQAKIALTNSSVLMKIKDRLTEIPELATLQWLATDSINNDLEPDWHKPSLGDENVAFLQYTSGSTGTPKGVIVSHGNLLKNEQMIQKGFGHTDKTIFAGWLPLFHDMGLIGNVLQPFYLGVPCILMSPVAFLQKPIRWLRAISNYKATTSGGPNFAYDLCVRMITPEQREGLDLSSWEIAFAGAEPVRAETLQQFASTFKSCGFREEAFYPCYGMAETTLFATGGLKTEPPVIRTVKKASLEENKAVSITRKGEEVSQIVGCGQIWLNEELMIVDPNTLTQCPEGQVGEIWVAGGHVAQGYWNRPELTEQVFQAHVADTGAGPFLRTGDLGFVQDGELFVTGRLKDVIIIRGRNHYPQDIELTVENSHPALRAGCGAAFAAQIKGQERLVVVQEVERTYLRKINVSEVVGSVRQVVMSEHGLAVYAVALVKTGSIPKTSSGKIRRHACRDGFLAGKLNMVKDWSENPQNKVEFLNLQAEIDSMLQKLKTGTHN
ncbi:MAG: fatty acyl-AMP ligase [Xenococcaceae cyanobacterium MO_167.B27]|nr:fatty acyl-AMP ligase [Xenococcaceae cyanobacterium MO_167.B27]